MVSAQSEGKGVLQLPTSLTATGTHVPYGIIQCYLPPGRGDILALDSPGGSTDLTSRRIFSLAHQWIARGRTGGGVDCLVVGGLCVGSSREPAHQRDRVPPGPRQQRRSRLHVDAAGRHDRPHGASPAHARPTEGRRRGRRLPAGLRGRPRPAVPLHVGPAQRLQPEGLRSRHCHGSVSGSSPAEQS